MYFLVGNRVGSWQPWQMFTQVPWYGPTISDIDSSCFSKFLSLKRYMCYNSKSEHSKAQICPRPALCFLYYLRIESCQICNAVLILPRNYTDSDSRNPVQIRDALWSLGRARERVCSLCENVHSNLTVTALFDAGFLRLAIFRTKTERGNLCQSQGNLRPTTVRYSMPCHREAESGIDTTMDD